MLNPCCCLSPRIGVFIFAVIDLLFAVSYTWAVLQMIIDHHFRTEMIGEIVICAALLTMAILLLLGAYKNAADKIRLWLILWIVFLILTLIFQGFNVYRHKVDGRSGSSFAAFALFIYQVWVVYAYLVELRSGPSALTYCPTQITV